MKTTEEIEKGIYSHLERLGGHEKLHEYIDKVWDFLFKMPTDKMYTVTRLADAANVDLFTNVVLIFIHSFPGEQVYFIKDDLKRFRKYEKMN